MRSIASFRSPGALPRLGVAVAGAALVVAGCGARTGTRERDAGQPLGGDGAIVGCLGDLDCGAADPCAPVHCVAGACVAALRVVCDDHDACTEDACAPSGQCEFRPLTRDEDADGHRGPLPGFKAGAPGACGDDCDDTSGLAFPGGKEVCDGVDNDCNGVVDDGARYEPVNVDPVLLSGDAKQAGIGGVAFGSPAFAASFSSTSGATWSNTFTAFDASGTITVPATRLTHENTDAFTGPVVWTGSAFALAWEDRRDKDFEIYFNRVDPSGKKLSRDLRVTNAPGFSLRPDLVWGGAEYVVVWSDRREGDTLGRVFGQRIDASGKLVGGNLPLTPAGIDVDIPSIAKGDAGFGLVFTERSAGLRQLFFRTVSPDLSSLGPPVQLGSGDVTSSTIAWSGDRYVVAWDTVVRGVGGDKVPGPAIRGAAVAPDGSILVSEQDVTVPAAFARSEALLPLGDRLLLVWADVDLAGAPFSLYSAMIGRDLAPVSAGRRVTFGPSDSVNPAMAFGPGGDVAVAFEDLRSGKYQVYVTRLACVAGPLP